MHIAQTSDTQPDNSYSYSLLEPQKLFFSLRALYFKSSTYISWGYTIGCFSVLGGSEIQKISFLFLVKSNLNYFETPKMNNWRQSHNS